MKYFLKKKYLFLIAAILGSIILFFKWISPNTPRGIDVDPIYDIKFKGLIDIIDKIPDNISKKNSAPLADVKNMVFVYPLNDANKDVFRGIEIYQFKSDQAAIAEYWSQKRIFTNQTVDRLYKEEGNYKNRYFIAYKTTRLNRNHGIPIGIITSPEIVIGFLKNNILIIISYTGYKNYKNYIAEINSDISYTSVILKTAIKKD